ncbi:MAG: hypothetical protein ACFFF4_03020 [Candidatus Thorarchaeota archaeon]
MMSSQVISTSDAREKARKAFTDYLSMFLPGSWQEPLARIKLLLQSNGETDWEALKGHALQVYDERRHSNDRVESLARVERLAEACKLLHSTLPPTEWHKALDDVIYAAQFRTAKIAVQTIASVDPIAEKIDKMKESAEESISQVIAKKKSKVKAE